MAGLVEEIQAASLDSTVSIADLLRKVTLAASKLKLADAADWVDKELNGYKGVSETDLPPYRRGHGTLMMADTFRRRQLDGDPLTVRACSQVFLFEPIATIEALNDGEGDRLVKSLPHEMEKTIKDHLGLHSCTLNVEFGKSMLVGVMDGVRNAVLKWAIGLEEAGILGEGVSFSVDEKKKAAEAAPSIINNYGLIHNGNNSGHQNRTMVGSTDNSTNTIDIDSTFQNLTQAVQNGVDNKAHREDLLEIIRVMRATQGTPDYKPAFQNLISYVAEYVTILTPFLPALGQMMG
ncbi:hypothetical protein BH10PLA2_BH10PLA2_01040 [soil metagenome]